MNCRALALVVLIPITLQAQTGSARAELSRAIAAYQNLDFDVAAITLRRVLERELSVTERIEALTYLGAAEHYRARPDSTRAVFHRLILLAPEFQLDTLVFPPEVTRVFADVKSSTNVEPPVQVAMPLPDTLVQQPPVDEPPPPPPPPPVPVRSHHGIMGTGSGIVANMRTQSEGGGLPSASGTVLGVAASARLGRFELGVKYLEGSLGTRDLVEGAAALRFVATPWLALHAGPHVRRYETSLGSGAERWAMWQVGARAEAPIVGTSVRGHATLWQGLGLRVNVPPGSGTAGGGEIGATIMVPGPFRFGIAYSIDHASVQGASRRETVNALIVTAGVR